MKLREVSSGDHLFISILLGMATGGHHQSRLVERLRDDGDMALELVAEDDATGRITGHIFFGKLGKPEGWWNVSPVAVVQDRQNSDIGDEILRYGLDRARQARAQAVIATGDARRLARFGFSAQAADGMVSPHSGAQILLYPIAPGAAGRKGNLVYPAAFDILLPSAE